MYSKQEQNLILYQKAKQKITIHLILYFAILCIYFFLMAYLFSNIEFLKVDDPSFHSMLLKLTAGQLILYGITFVLLSLGNKWFRILYWIDLVITLLLIYFPIHLLLSNLKNILPFQKGIDELFEDNYEKLDEEIKKTNDFIMTLKDLQKHLD